MTNTAAAPGPWWQCRSLGSRETAKPPKGERAALPKPGTQGFRPPPQREKRAYLVGGSSATTRALRRSTRRARRLGQPPDAPPRTRRRQRSAAGKRPRPSSGRGLKRTRAGISKPSPEGLTQVATFRSATQELPRSH